MAFYESVFIARQDITPQQADELATQFAGIISAQGGSVTKTENWGLKNLAYRIKKNRKGHYILMNIDAPGTAVIELERNMRISEDVLRYMTVRVDELEAGPSAPMRKERDRDYGDRDGFGGGGFGGGSRGGFGGGDRGYRPSARGPRSDSDESTEV